MFFFRSHHSPCCRGLGHQAGAIVVAGLISPYAADRDYAREVFQPQPIYGVKRVRVEAGEEGRNGGSLVIYGDLMELIADLELIYHG